MNLRISHLCAVLVPSLIGVSFSSAAIMTTPQQSVSLRGMFVDGFGSPSDSFFDADQVSPISGFTKFDPSLGTLKEVRMGMGVSGSVDYFELYAQSQFGEEPSEEDRFAINFSGGSSNIHVGFRYNASVGNSGVLVGSSLFDLPTIDVDEPVFLYTSGSDGEFFLDYYTSSDDIVDYNGAFGLGSDLTGTLSSETSSFFLESDFVGSGTVSTVSAFLILTGATDSWTISGISDEDVGASFDVNLDQTLFTLEYVYDTGVIPEPSVLSTLVGLVALGALNRRRRR